MKENILKELNNIQNRLVKLSHKISNEERCLAEAGRLAPVKTKEIRHIKKILNNLKHKQGRLNKIIENEIYQMISFV